MGGTHGQKHNPYIQGRYAHVNPNDVVFTPDWLAQEIVSMFPISGKVLEPCKGEGAFLKVLPPQTEWCEIVDGKNFYDYLEKVDWIVTNPPYSDYNRFLSHSFEIAENIVLLVPFSKMFKSMGTIKATYAYGVIVSIDYLPASQAGFPFGFPVAVFHIKKDYKGTTQIREFKDSAKNPSYNTRQDGSACSQASPKLPEQLELNGIGQLHLA